MNDDPRPLVTIKEGLLVCECGVYDNIVETTSVIRKDPVRFMPKKEENETDRLVALPGRWDWDTATMRDHICLGCGSSVRLPDLPMKEQ